MDCPDCTKYSERVSSESARADSWARTAARHLKDCMGQRLAEPLILYQQFAVIPAHPRLVNLGALQLLGKSGDLSGLSPEEAKRAVWAFFARLAVHPVERHFFRGLDNTPKPTVLFRQRQCGRKIAIDGMKPDQVLAALSCRASAPKDVSE